jgi:LAGLIDADG-like domain
LSSTNYRKVTNLTSVDAAYLAGLLDGEGTITLSRRHAAECRQLVVSIANTEPRLLEFVLQRVGAGKITRKRFAATAHTPSLTYSISNRQALSLLEQLQPFLRSHKRMRAELVLPHYVTVVPRNGKRSVERMLLRLEFEKQFFAITSRTQELG